MLKSIDVLGLNSQFPSVIRECRDVSVEMGLFLCGIQVRAVQAATVARCASHGMVVRACGALQGIMIELQKPLQIKLLHLKAMIQALVWMPHVQRITAVTTFM